MSRSPEVEALARSWAGGIRARLGSGGGGRRAALRPRPTRPAGDGPTRLRRRRGPFLCFGPRRGPDYQFATAAAVLLRSLGYRTRLVSGLYAAPGATTIPAHAPHLPSIAKRPRLGRGSPSGGTWVGIDPTPGYQIVAPAAPGGTCLRPSPTRPRVMAHKARLLSGLCLLVLLAAWSGIAMRCSTAWPPGLVGMAGGHPRRVHAVTVAVWSSAAVCSGPVARGLGLDCSGAGRADRLRRRPESCRRSGRTPPSRRLASLCAARLRSLSPPCAGRRLAQPARDGPRLDHTAVRTIANPLPGRKPIT